VSLCLALDIGATKLGAGLVDRSGLLCARANAPTPRADDPEVLFCGVTDLLDGLIERSGDAPVALGVGSAGPLHDHSEVSPLNIPAWRGFPIRARLEQRYGLVTFLDLDAKALALAEGWLGGARGKKNYLAMVVSSGVGGGLVLDGRLVDGRSGNAGHVGHIIVEPGGRHCSCGGRGCLEAEASGLAIAAITGRPPAQASPETITRTATMVGRALASVANFCDLDLILVAGSVALGYGQAFFDTAQRTLHENARQSYALSTRVLPAELGEAGPLIGAAAVAWSGLGEDLLAERLVG
jgi:glucokinase